MSLALEGGVKESEIDEAACTAANRRRSTSKPTTRILVVASIVVLTKTYHHIRDEELCNLRCCDGHNGIGSGRSLSETLQVQRAHCWIHWNIAQIPSRCQVLMWSHLIRWYLGGVCLLIFSFELRGRALAATCRRTDRLSLRTLGRDVPAALTSRTSSDIRCTG